MFSSPGESIIIFVVSVVVLLGLFCVFIITIIYKYQRRQIAYLKEMEQLKADHENTLLQSQLEMQEQTFQHIAREIHDNIGQKLTLAKLYLNTLSYNGIEATGTKVESSLELISAAISDLSDVSRSMSTDLIENNGLVKVTELEVKKLQKFGMYRVDFFVEGKELFLETSKEVILFRILQEAINNIVKHSDATVIDIRLIYSEASLIMTIDDNGKGFDTNKKKDGAGLLNIRKRAAHLQGTTFVSSGEKGTKIIIKIPINENSIT